VPVETVSATNAKLDGELRGADWSDGAQFRTIRSFSTETARTGDNTAKVSGNLTFHGVTEPTRRGPIHL